MIRALYAGASAIRAHLVMLDVIGNNIANMNTVGFKASRVTFEEALAHFISAATRPDEGIGGKNPTQIGTGVQVGSIDNIFTQGGLEMTTLPTDLAIQGEGFFVVADPQGEKYYTRAGMFRLDAYGHLVTPDGLILQGKMAAPWGRIPTVDELEDILLPIEEKMPARATTEVKFTCNLNMEENPLGTILNSGKMLGDALATEDVNGLFNGSGSQLALTPADSITFTVDGNDITISYDPTGDAGPSDQKFNTLQGLAQELQSFLNTVPGHGADTVAVVSGAGAGLETYIQWTNTAACNAQFQSTNKVLEGIFVAYNGSIGVGNVDSDNFLHTAVETDPLIDIYSRDGTWLDLNVGETIILSGKTGTTTIGPVNHVIAGTDTLGTLCGWIETDFIITIGDAYIDTEGKLVVKGDPGTDDALTVLVTQGANAVFNQVMGVLAKIQEATDVIHETAFTVYDSLGTPHVITMKFKKDETILNLWHWEATVDVGTIISGNTGTVTFNPDGSLSSFNYDGGADAFYFNPETGATDPVKIDFNAGTPGKWDGITQFAAPSTTIVTYQDGYTMGTLKDISIEEHGDVVATFTNGVIRKIAEIPLATFANPAGLLKKGDSLWVPTSNSGIPVMGRAGVTLPGTFVSSGYLEQANVDLANEFINMIIAQRGFQANARIISTGDTVLGELIALRR